MPSRQLFSIAIASLLANKTRALLTMLGIVIGVSSVILLVSVGQGLKNSITGQLEGLGTNLLMIMPGKQSFSRGPNPASFSTSKLKEQDVKNITDLAYEVEDATGVIQASAPVKFADKSDGVMVMGVGDNYLNIRNSVVERGDFLQKTDVDSVKRVAVIGPTIATDFFGDINPLGEKILIGSSRYNIVGILKSQGSFGASDADKEILIPLSTAKKQFNKDTLSMIMAQAKSADNINLATDEIQQILEKRMDKDEFTIVDQKSLTNTLSSILGTLTLALGGIAAISLLVGGIGIMNIMLVSVTERTKEIGLRKALGATPEIILAQFLIEAILLSVGGGILGILLGVGGSLALNHVLATTVTWWSILLAFLVSAGIGIIFGVMPARRAARLSPIEALRYE